MPKGIKSISFLYRGERVIVKASRLGAFRVPITSVFNGRVETKYKNLSAGEVIRHGIIRDCDPVLTLESGEKIRVYHAGDSSYLPAMVEGIILKHDGERGKIIPSFTKRNTFWSNSEQYEFPWEDLYGDAD